MATKTENSTTSDDQKTSAPSGTARTTSGSSTTTVSSGSTGANQPAAERGTTSIADGVVEKIAGMAAREVPGVHALGGGFSRTLGAVRDRVPGGKTNVSRGVKVEVGQKQTAIDLDVVLEYGEPIQEVTEGIRENVISALERMTGLEVVEVNITVDDVHLPEDEDATERETRVQ